MKLIVDEMNDEEMEIMRCAHWAKYQLLYSALVNVTLYGGEKIRTRVSCSRKSNHAVVMSAVSFELLAENEKTCS